MRTLALLGLFVTSPAAAQPQQPDITKWAACYMVASGGVGTSLAHITFEPFQVSNRSGAISEYGLAREFDEKVGIGTVVAGYKSFTGSYSNGCTFFDSRADALAEVARLQNKRGYSIMKTVAWTPPSEFTGVGGGKGAARVTASSGSKGAYQGKPDVEIAKPPVEPGWDEKVREQQRKDAAERVRLAASTAKMRAESEAALTGFLAKLKERGRAQ